MAFQESGLDRVEEDEYGEVYAGHGYRVWIRNGRVSQIRDDNTGCTKTYQKGILQAIHVDNPLEEAISLCTFFSVDPVVTFEIRSEEEIRRIQEGIAEQGMSYLEDGGYFVLENGGTYVAVD